MRFMFVVLAVCAGLGMFGAMVNGCTSDITFDQEVESHLKAAADAQEVPLAQQELNIAITYLEGHGLTSGHTGIIYDTRATDIGYWYTNLKGCQHELSLITPETTALERSNVLMRLRSSLLDHGSEGEHVTLPEQVAIYPHQGLTIIGGFVAFLLCILFVLGAMVMRD